jgi:uncharacterized protein
MKPHLTISPTVARRLAVARQRLAGPRPEPTSETMLEVTRDLGCLQLDPISAVARSHLLVLWSRLGNYDLPTLDKLLYSDYALFEYWAHAASIVLTEDYPIHHWLMRRYAVGDSPWATRVRAWMQENKDLQAHILTEIREKGPLPSRYFEDKSSAEWYSTGWTGGRNVSQMLGYLWTDGTIMVAGRSGLQKLWDLSDRCLPEWTPRDTLPEDEVVRRAAQKSLRALGVATQQHIKLHYTRNRYPGLPHVLKDLEAEGCITRVKLADDGREWPGPWYVHRDDLPLLEGLSNGSWQPRTPLLSPFDNLICDRARTEKLFHFYFRIEIYVPKEKRQFGYYVLPILHGDRLIGRIDPTMDRKHKRLNINAIYAEPDAPTGTETARAVAGAIEELASFLGAREVAYTSQVPEPWKKVLN